MKKTGLRNRFSNETRHVWLYWHSCMICGRNQQDVLHHIMSPSTMLFVDGEHNTSVFNSCPIHNYGCHIGNEAYLNSEVGVKTLLRKTAEALIEMDYRANETDRIFIHTYRHLYPKKLLEMVKWSS